MPYHIPKVCVSCGRRYIATTGVQKWCSPLCKQQDAEQAAKMTRFRKPPINYCPCGKPCRNGEFFCSIICEKINARMGGSR